MRQVLAIAAALLLPASAAAQQPDWNGAPVVEVTLSSFAFAPETLHLRAGRPVILHLVNASSGGHNFKASEFFAASVVREGDRPALRDGTVEVGHGTSRDIAIVPRAGHYPLKCSHTLHATFGMKGEIVVD
jgi:plastocyanin